LGMYGHCGVMLQMESDTYGAVAHAKAGGSPDPPAHIVRNRNATVKYTVR
jgi:hypothetical protein